MKKALLPLAVTAAVTLSAGCSDSKHNSAPPSDITKSTLSGTAAKGIIQSGIVTAVELDSSGSDVATVGTTKTDERGHYELKLGDNYTGGVVRLRISADSNTTMKCDAFDGCGGSEFGDSVSLGSNFSLDAVVKPEADTVKVQITPLTHMAAARALSSATVNADTIASAVSEVNQIVGVNIMENEIVDITDASSLEGASAEAKQLALFNAGLAEVLVDGNMQTNLDKLASSFEDGQFSSTDGITITEITTAVSEATVDAAANEDISAALEDEIDAVETTIAVIESATSGGVYNPEPASNTALTEVAQAKAMLTNGRTFVEQIGANFDAPMDALDVDAQLAEDVLSEDTAAMSQLLTDVIDQVFSNLGAAIPDLAAELANPTVGGHAVEIFDDAMVPNSLGTVTATISSAVEGISISISDSLTGVLEGGGSRTVTLTDVKIATNIAASQLTFDAIETNLLMAISSVDGAELEVTGVAAADAVGETPATSITLNSVALAVDFSSAQDPINTHTSSDEQDDVLESALSAASFMGDMIIAANGATFDGGVELKLVNFSNTLGENPLSLQKIALDGDFSSANGTFSAAATLMIDNATSFDTYALIDHDEKLHSYLNFTPVTGMSTADVDIVMAAITGIEASEGGSPVNSWKLRFSSEGAYWLDAWRGNEGYETVSLSGMSSSLEDSIKAELSTKLGVTPIGLNVESAIYTPSDIATPAVGQMQVLVDSFFPPYENASNFVKGTLILTTTASVPGLADTTVVASASRTALNGGAVAVTVTQSGQSFKLETAVTDTEAAEVNGTLTLTTPDGAKLLLNLMEAESEGAYVMSGTASVNGVQVGEVSETDNGLTLIRYNDGSFESIF